MSLSVRRCLTASTALAVVAVAGVASAATSSAAPSTSGTQSLVSVLMADGDTFDGNWDDYDILTQAVVAVLKAKPDSPVKVLADGTTPVTAFLPTDRAFQDLAKSLTGTTYHQERGVFNALVSAAGVDTIEAVLLYHVVPGATVTSADVLAKRTTKVNTALPEAGLTIATISAPYGVVRLRDLDTTSKDAYLIGSQLDINKGNKQIAHGITSVLRPIDLP